MSRLGALFSGVQGQDTPIQPYHTSFRDFLTDEKRSKKWYIDIQGGHYIVALGSLRIMNRQLSFNISRLPSSFLSNEEMLDTRPHQISPALEYASRFWCYHLRLAPNGNISRQCMTIFAKEKLLFWFEVLSVLGALNIAAPTLQTFLQFEATKFQPVSRTFPTRV